jgi:hypothetical protein
VGGVATDDARRRRRVVEDHGHELGVRVRVLIPRGKCGNVI